MAVERLELIIEQAGQDHALLEDGEHVSGPFAAEYRARVERAAGFAGRVVTASATPSASLPGPTRTSTTATA